MANRNRKIYDVDEDVLKRVVAGDVFVAQPPSRKNIF